MLDENGFIANGDIIFNDDLSETYVNKDARCMQLMDEAVRALNENTKLEAGSDIYNRMEALRREKEERAVLSAEEDEKLSAEIDRMVFDRTEKNNYRMTLDSKKDKEEIKALGLEIKDMDKAIKAKQDEKKAIIRQRRESAKNDTEYNNRFNARMARLEEEYKSAVSGDVSEEKVARNELIAKEIYLSIGRYSGSKRNKALKALLEQLKKAMQAGKDLSDPEVRRSVFDREVLYVRYIDEDDERLHGEAMLNLAKIKYADDWTKIRGNRIATVFQDPMTSLNPVLTIGKQISTVIIKHQKCSQGEAKKRTLDIMAKVGIPEPEKRYDDYPFMYSGGMRQRIVIAIALSCQPKILICDEPTTALDVTIQAQIIRLIKDLQHQLGYTTVYITHDLGVVANVAERVAVLYGGQIVELGTVEDIFYEPKHPYTWALLSSLTQLAEKGDDLFSIPGTPPSLYNKIIGDAFAPRNAYAMAIDRVKEPPMFQINDHHWAKTWLLDPRAPEVEPPKIIQNLHEKMLKSYVNVEG
jgi:oligopeptide transport system ATP-binding protein